jgi:hypothetical protein
VIAAIPRHLFVPYWWRASAAGSGDGADIWERCDGPAEEDPWARVAYRDQSLVTRVGPLHADHAAPGDRPVGLPTSSATLPGLIVQMLRHAHIDAGAYLTHVAAERLAGIGLRPQVITGDATGPLPGSYDRIVSTVAVRPIPASWLAALRPGGRLVTTITGTALILTADKTDDGGAIGRIEWDRAGFMPTRTGADYPRGRSETFAVIRQAAGEQVSVGRYPVVNIVQAWEIWSMLGIIAPGIEYHYHQDDDGQRTAWMLHPDGSWARATGMDGAAPRSPSERSASVVGHRGRHPVSLATGRFPARLRSHRHDHSSGHLPAEARALAGHHP